MVELATRDNIAFVPSDIELVRPGPSYTIETMRYFQDKFGPQVHFIAGQDAMEDIGSWRSAEVLLKSCNFIVMTRPGYDPHILRDVLQGVLSVRYKNLNLKPAVKSEGDVIESFGVTGGSSHINLVSVTPLDISSSEIRRRLGRGQPVKYLVPEVVDEYLKKERLFQ